MAGQGNSKVVCANVLHIVFASSGAHLCMGSYDTYGEVLISCFKCEIIRVARALASHNFGGICKS